MSDQLTGRPEATPLSGPVAEGRRIESIDVVRGLALLGILVMNVQSFSMPMAAYMNPMIYGDLGGANLAVWLVSHLLADQKFMTIFSMLFGAGLILMTRRRDAAGLPAAGVHYRRMGWLLALGALHAYLLWYGDILFTYAVCGMLIYPMRRWRPATLALLGMAAVAIPSALFLLMQASLPYWPEAELSEFRVDWAPPPEVVQAEVRAYRGGWLEQMAHRLPTAIEFQTFVLPMLLVWRAGGLMLVGMALCKTGVLSGAAPPRVYRVMIAIAAAVGLPAIGYGAWRNFAAGWDFRYSFILGGQVNYWASILVSLGYIGAVMLLVRAGVWAWLRRGLAAVGRTALSNYLLQSILCTLVFYGHGLGLFGRVERAGQIAVVAAVWAVQIALSLWWLGRYQFGPGEWLWRALTYLRRPALRRPSGLPGAGEV